jgi:hypothetical protein
MISAQQLDALDPQTRQAMLSLMTELTARDEQLRAKDVLIAQRDREAAFKQALIDKLTHEMAVLKRLKFAATSERFASTLAPEQKSLLEETLDADLAELEREIERERGQADDKPKDKTEKKTPKRTPLPPHLPRHDVPREPPDTSCSCGRPMQRFGEDVAERLDYQPGVFSVERHVRGKWACRCCEKIVQAPVPAHVIDKGNGLRGSLMQREAVSISPSLRSTSPSSSTPPSLVMLPPSKRPSTTRRPRRPNSIVPTSTSSLQFGFGIARSFIKIRHLDKRASNGQCRPRFYGGR